MAKVLTDSKHYTDIANAIRAKTGENEQYTPSEMGSAIRQIPNAPTVNGEKLTGELAFQPATTYTPSTLDQIISSNQYLIGNQTIKGDANLVAENIVSGKSIFGVVGSAEVTGYTADDIATRSITEAIGSATSIGAYAFNGCRSLTTASFPNCSRIGDNAFYNCYRLTTVSFPVCKSIGDNAFYYCSALTTVSFPNCSRIGDSAFYYCFNLTTVSFPVCTSIGQNAFLYCYNLKSLYLTGSSVCTLSASNAFSSTPIGGYSTSAGTYGSIYVPASLLTQYQSATNWTYFSSRFVAYDENGGANLINFTIDGVSYQAEEGMTWGEWVNSQYNTSGFINSSDTSICNSAGIQLKDVFAEDVIISGNAYSINIEDIP